MLELQVLPRLLYKGVLPVRKIGRGFLQQEQRADCGQAPYLRTLVLQPYRQKVKKGSCVEIACRSVAVAGDFVHHSGRRTRGKQNQPDSGAEKINYSKIFTVINFAIARKLFLRADFRPKETKWKNLFSGSP